MKNLYEVTVGRGNRKARIFRMGQFHTYGIFEVTSLPPPETVMLSLGATGKHVWSTYYGKNLPKQLPPIVWIVSLESTPTVTPTEYCGSSLTVLLFTFIDQNPFTELQKLMKRCNWNKFARNYKF